ncbi:DUF349 domain-containing protein [Mangrovimonas aestuarii]|uniref:DUF349 domain-containing protein n=1 Tax=Mangrovimonas aestuarii TaxID=3018443 RepID=UPI002377D930|nr:DUF349 domain-containing protein [Mangrovimonas aestuarii]
MSEQDNLQHAEGTEEQKSTNQVIPKDENSDLNTQNHEDDSLINEIDDSNAEDAEDEGNSERHIIEFKEYDKMSMDALSIELDRLVSNEKVQAIRAHVDAIKKEFNLKYNALIEEKKDDFINEGGNEIDFYYSSPVHRDFKNTYKEYRNKLHTHYKTIENNLKDNLEIRLAIIEEIKGLLNVEENINTTYKHFKELQEKWRTAGPIPRDKYNNAWNSYHHHVERFYDFLHINRDLRDLDFKHNLEQKQKIVYRAQELAKDDNINRSFRELQALHKIWKEELGPVAREHREEIWGQFKAATKAIHDKRQAYFAEIEKHYEKNLEKKIEIIEKIKAITGDGGKSHNVWQNKIKEVEALREEFFNAGKVPLNVNEETWAKFKEAVRAFNRKKNVFYKNLKKEQYDNLQSKLDLITIAEDNKDSDDFETVTPLMKKIQKDWKSIGHVPRKESDKIWNQFKAACNHYFDRLHAVKNAANKEEMEAFKQKSDLLDEIKNIELSGDHQADLERIKAIIEKWKSLGIVPRNKRYIEGKFNKSLDGLFNTLNVNKHDAEMIKFENTLENLNSADDQRAIDSERIFISKKIDEIKGEINQLENNLQFFTNVEDDNPVVKDVKKNIRRHKESLKLWRTKLSKIKDLY